MKVITVSIFPSLFLHFTAEQDSVAAPFFCKSQGLLSCFPPFTRIAKSFDARYPNPTPSVAQQLLIQTWNVS